jgi:hypothetical protein
VALTEGECTYITLGGSLPNFLAVTNGRGNARRARARDGVRDTWAGHVAPVGKRPELLRKQLLQNMYLFG